MAAIDLLTLAEAKEVISNNAGPANDSLLTAYITGVSIFLDRRCGPIVVRTCTDTFDGGPMAYDWRGPMQQRFGTNANIFLRSYPVVSVASVTEYATGVGGVTLTEQTSGNSPAAGFTINKRTGKLSRTTSGYPGWFAAGNANITVTYTAGRYTNTDAVAEHFKRAAGLVLANIWRQERGMAATDYGDVSGVTYLLPNAAEALLLGELQGVA